MAEKKCCPDLKCGTSFADYDAIALHLKDCHASENYCLIKNCLRKFKTRETLKRHIKTIHCPTKVYACTKCTMYTTTRTDSMDLHVERCGGAGKKHQHSVALKHNYAANESTESLGPNSAEVSDIQQLNQDHSLSDVIRGVAIQDVWLFLVFENRPDIQKFNVDTLEHQRSISIGRLQDPWDITASDDDVYISERTRGKIIVRSGDGSLTEWSIDGVNITLSLSWRNSLIACCPDKILYLDLLGRVYRTFRLDGLDGNPRSDSALHAVSLPDDHLVVCDGQHHRLIQMDEKWKECRSFGEPTKLGSDLNLPHYLVNFPGGNFLVADSGNGRILLMSRWLELVKVLIPPTYGMKKPYRMCLDKESTRLFVVDDDELMIFYVIEDVSN